MDFKSIYLKKSALNIYFKKLKILALVLLVIGCTNKKIDHSKQIKQISKSNYNKVLDNYKNVQNRSSKAQDKDTTVIVALSGGGLRAANFALGSMLALESIEYKNSDMLRQVDYFTSVSGGGLAIGAYVSSLLRQSCEQRASFNFLNYLHNDTRLLKSLREGFLANGNLLKMMNPNVMFTLKDRGDVLQNSLANEFFTLENNIDDCSDRNLVKPSNEVKLGHIFMPADSTALPTIPYVISNATNHSNGEIVHFTPHHLESTGISCYIHKMKKVPIEKGYFYEMPFAVGVRSSSNFPVGLPTSTFDSSPYTGSSDLMRDYCKGYFDSREWDHVHMTDGGQADNLGINSAISLLNYEHSRNQNNSDNKYMLLLVDAFNGEKNKSSKRQGSGTLWNELIHATNIPLTAFRLITKASLSNKDATSFSYLDAISGQVDINVGYIHLDEMHDQYSSVGTVMPTAMGLTDKTQSELIALGVYKTLSVFGEDDILAKTNDIIFQLYGRDVPKIKSGMEKEGVDIKQNNLVKFSKFKKRQLRGKLTEGVIEKTTEYIDSINEVVKKIEMRIVIDELSVIEDKLEKMQIELNKNLPKPEDFQPPKITRNVLNPIKNQIEAAERRLHIIEKIYAQRKFDNNLPSIVRKVTGTMLKKDCDNPDINSDIKNDPTLHLIAMRDFKCDALDLEFYMKPENYQQIGLNATYFNKLVEIGGVVETSLETLNQLVSWYRNVEGFKKLKYPNFQPMFKQAISLSQQKYNDLYINKLNDNQKSNSEYRAMLDSNNTILLEYKKGENQRISEIDFMEYSDISNLSQKLKQAKKIQEFQNSLFQIPTLVEHLQEEKGCFKIVSKDIESKLSINCKEPENKIICHSLKTEKEHLNETVDDLIELIKNQVNLWPNHFIREKIKFSQFAGITQEQPKQLKADEQVLNNGVIRVKDSNDDEQITCHILDELHYRNNSDNEQLITHRIQPES